MLQIVEFVFETIRVVNPDVANVSPMLAEAIGKGLGMAPNPMFTEDTVCGRAGLIVEAGCFLMFMLMPMRVCPPTVPAHAGGLYLGPLRRNQAAS